MVAIGGSGLKHCSSQPVRVAPRPSVLIQNKAKQKQPAPGLLIQLLLCTTWVIQSWEVIKSREVIMSNCFTCLLLTVVREEKNPLSEQGEGEGCEPGARTPWC